MGLGIRTRLIRWWRVISGKEPRKFEGHYIIWRQRRIEAIERHYGRDFFNGKAVLELGAGHGDIGAHFAKLGAIVTCVEGRPKNARYIRRRHPEVEVVTADIDGAWPFDRRYDVVLHLGVLYHLKHYRESLVNACDAAAHLILETEVCDSSDPDEVIFVNENVGGYDQSLSGIGCRPSPANVEAILRERGMHFERLEDGSIDTVHNIPNFPDHLYRWQIKDTKIYKPGLRKFWFARREPVGE